MNNLLETFKAGFTASGSEETTVKERSSSICFTLHEVLSCPVVSSLPEAVNVAFNYHILLIYV
jgi:hypothetical protein